MTLLRRFLSGQTSAIKDQPRRGPSYIEALERKKAAEQHEDQDDGQDDAGLPDKPAAGPEHAKTNP